jgi:hypothetical protein
MSAWLITSILWHFGFLTSPCALSTCRRLSRISHGLLGLSILGSFPIPWDLLRHPSSLPPPPTLWFPHFDSCLSPSGPGTPARQRASAPRDHPPPGALIPGPSSAATVSPSKRHGAWVVWRRFHFGRSPRKSHRMQHQPKSPRMLRPRTAGRHDAAQPPTRPPVQRPHLPAPLQGGPDQRTPPTRDAMHRLHVPMPMPRLLPRTHAAPAHPARRNDRTHTSLHAPTKSQETSLFAYGSRSLSTLATRSLPVHMVWEWEVQSSTPW